MNVSVVTHGHRIEIQTNTLMTPVETVRYDGREVSRKVSWFNSKHEFEEIENGKKVRYTAELKLFSFPSMISVVLHRDGEKVFAIT